MHLFCYGTLMFPAVWRLLVACENEKCSATLPGYVVRKVRDDVYPVLVDAEAGSEANGVVYFNVDGRAVARLDAYEGGIYQRRQVVVEATECGPLVCQAYVLKHRHRGLATATPWDADHFERALLADYVARLAS